MGYTDRLIRLIIACIIFVLWFEDFFVKGIPGVILLAAGGILLLTSLVGACPLYSLFGINSCPKKKKDSIAD